MNKSKCVKGYVRHLEEDPKFNAAVLRFTTNGIHAIFDGIRMPRHRAMVKAIRVWEKYL